MPLLTNLLQETRELVPSLSPQGILLGPNQETSLSLQAPDGQAVLLEFSAQLIF